ncbi:MAG: sigma-70 family RNA polymerase sigma factor [Verrucomicrobiota bacterium]
MVPETRATEDSSSAQRADFFYRKPKNEEERRHLIELLLPMVNHIVGRMALYFPPHLSRDDLISAGVMGLMDAVDRFDEGKGTSLKTYCSLRIKGSIVDELRRLDWVPRSVHREARQVQETQEKLAQKLKREPTEDELCTELGLESEDFQKLMDRVKPTSYLSLQEPIREGVDGDTMTHEDVVADQKAMDASEKTLHEEDIRILKDQMIHLPMHHQQVLALYYIEDLRLKEIADVLDLTESRVSQIHTLAINRLRSAFKRARQR